MSGQPVKADDHSALQRWALVIGFLAGAIATALLASCNTIEAAERLPEDYWLSTWLLLEGVVKDVLSLFSWAF